jgi:hypothetical protein
MIALSREGDNMKRIMALIILLLVFTAVCVEAADASENQEFHNILIEESFSDISPDDDNYRFICAVYECGLMNGKGGGIFDPDGSLTAAELITLAARLHVFFYNTTYVFEKTDIWYETYMDYCISNDILIPEYEDLSSFVTMREMASVLSALLPDELANEKVFIQRITYLEDEDSAGEEIYESDIYKVCAAGIMDAYNAQDGQYVFPRFDAVARSYAAKVLSRIVRPHIQGTFSISDCTRIEAGDYLLLGSYEQDNDLSNGSEPIEWRVLERNGNEILVISRYGIDCLPYNDSETDVTWETSSLRKWLNEQFLNTAFSPSERAVITETVVKAEGNAYHFPSYDNIREDLIEAGNDTTDMIFILSWNDILTNNRFVKREFDKQYGAAAPSLISWACVPTEYAVARGAFSSDFYVKGVEAEWGVETGDTLCHWWVRNPGVSNSTAVAISFSAGFGNYGFPVNLNTVAVRPAMWIRIPSGTQN